jgi:hypothetical protein
VVTCGTFDLLHLGQMNMLEPRKERGDRLIVGVSTNQIYIWAYSNTILVYIGDHDESFGEFGYSFHSHSMILLKIQVLFIFSHVYLVIRILAHLCDFKLFIIFFELLRLEFQNLAIGQSIGPIAGEFIYFVYSTNLGLIKKAVWCRLDLLVNQVLVFNVEHNSVPTSQQDEEYIETKLPSILKQRAVLE